MKEGIIIRRSVNAANSAGVRERREKEAEKTVRSSFKAEPAMRAATWETMSAQASVAIRNQAGSAMLSSIDTGSTPPVTWGMRTMRLLLPATLLLSLGFSALPAVGQPLLVTRLSGAQTRIDTRISTSTNDILTASDCGKLISYSNVSAITVTLPVATSLLSGCWMDVENVGAGTLTITPTTSTIDGTSSIVLTTNQGARIVDATTQYLTQRGQGSSSGGASSSGPSYSADQTTLNLTGTSFSVNTAVMTTRAGNGGQAGGDTNVLITSGSSSAYVGAATGNPIVVYTSGMRILAKIDTTTAGSAITLDAGAGAKSVYQNDGLSNPTTTQWFAGVQVLLSYDGALNGWRMLGGASSGGSSAVTTTLNLPIAGYNSGGSGVIPAWNNSNGGSAHFGDVPVLSLSASGTTYITTQFIWPSNLDTTHAVNVILAWGGGGNDVRHMSVSAAFGCATAGTATGTLTFGTAVANVALVNTGNYNASFTLSSVPIGSCPAGGLGSIKLSRDNTISNNSTDPFYLTGAAIQWTSH